MKKGVISRDRRIWRGVRKENTWHSQFGKVDYSCGVKPHSSGIGDKAVDWCKTILYFVNYVLTLIGQ